MNTENVFWCDLSYCFSCPLKEEYVGHSLIVEGRLFQIGLLGLNSIVLSSVSLYCPVQYQ